MKAPVNQKALYQSCAMLFERFSNGEISIEEASMYVKFMTTQNKIYSNELKRAEIEHQISEKLTPSKIRIVEMKNFEDIQIENSLTQ